ncbi:hypothetical protein T12_2118, partial [Trichinella patagoniensis]
LVRFGLKKYKEVFHLSYKSIIKLPMQNVQSWPTVQIDRTDASLWWRLCDRRSPDPCVEVVRRKSTDQYSVCGRSAADCGRIFRPTRLFDVQWRGCVQLSIQHDRCRQKSQPIFGSGCDRFRLWPFSTTARHRQMRGKSPRRRLYAFCLVFSSSHFTCTSSCTSSPAASDRSAGFVETSRLCAEHLFAWLDHLVVGHVAKNAFGIDQPFRRSFDQHIHLFRRNFFQLDIHAHPVAFLLVRESVATGTDGPVQKIHHVRINCAPLHLLN